MTTNTTTMRGAAWALDEAITKPLQAAWANGPQFFITSASAYMSAEFSGHHGILPFPLNWGIALGFEWAYLRGLASAERTSSRWVDALNWAAFATSVLFGFLYCLDKYGALPEPSGAWAALLALIHIIPLALLSICSAMVHKAVVSEDRVRRATRELAMMQEEGERIRAERAKREAEAQRAAEEAAWAAELKRRREETLLQIELENTQKQAALDAWLEGKRKTAAHHANVRARQANGETVRETVHRSPDGDTNGESETASGSQMNGVRGLTERDRSLLEQLRTLDGLSAETQAERLGVGRTKVFQLRKVLKSEEQADGQ